MAEAKQGLTAGALRQRRKRKTAAAKDNVRGVEKFTVEVAGVFKGDLRKMMKAHGLNKQQDIHQRLIINLIAANFEARAKMLKCITTPFVTSEEVSGKSINERLKQLQDAFSETEEKNYRAIH